MDLIKIASSAWLYPRIVKSIWRYDFGLREAVGFFAVLMRVVLGFAVLGALAFTAGFFFAADVFGLAFVSPLPKAASIIEPSKPPELLDVEERVDVERERPVRPVFFKTSLTTPFTTSLTIFSTNFAILIPRLKSFCEQL